MADYSGCSNLDCKKIKPDAARGPVKIKTIEYMQFIKILPILAFSVVAGAASGVVSKSISHSHIEPDIDITTVALKHDGVEDKWDDVIHRKKDLIAVVTRSLSTRPGITNMAIALSVDGKIVVQIVQEDGGPEKLFVENVGTHHLEGFVRNGGSVLPVSKQELDAYSNLRKNWGKE